MTNLHSPVAPAVVLRRTYPVPRERVFAAWTTPEIALRFFTPGENRATDFEMDVKTGGAFSFTMIAPDEERFIARGTYLEVNAPERLVMTWRWLEDNPADEHESLLTLEFNDLGGSSELILTHEKLASDESRDRHNAGWTGIVDKLATVL